MKKYYDPNFLDINGHALVEFLTQNFKERTGDDSKPFPYENPNEMVKILKDKLNSNNDGGATLLDVIDFLSKKSFNSNSPKNMGHQVSVASPASILLGLCEMYFNTTTANYETSLANAAVDKVIIDWLAEKIGYDLYADGILTTGATLGNLTALLTARAIKGDNVWENGNTKKMAILVSEQAHYCIDKAARVMGLGSDGVIKIKTNEKFQMDMDSLKNEYDHATARGLKIIAVVGSACTTSTGSFDDLTAIGEFCKKNDLWFHIDAAHGGSAIMSEKHKYLLNGINQADSVVVDFHKMFLAPNCITAVIYKNSKHAYKTFAQEAVYLFQDDSEDDWFNFGKRTYECTKPSSGLRVYGILSLYGEKFYKETTEYLYSLGQEFAQLIKNNSDFELLIEPQCNIVCFRFLKGNEDLNVLNKKIREKLLESGDFFISSTVIQGNFYLRTALMNPITTTDHLRELLTTIKNIANN